MGTIKIGNCCPMCRKGKATNTYIKSSYHFHHKLQEAIKKKVTTTKSTIMFTLNSKKTVASGGNHPKIGLTQLRKYLYKTTGLQQ
jgi:hypothetical protein